MNFYEFFKMNISYRFMEIISKYESSFDDSVGLRWAMRFCIPHKLPGDAMPLITGPH